MSTRRVCECCHLTENVGEHAGGHGEFLRLRNGSIRVGEWHAFPRTAVSLERDYIDAGGFSNEYPQYWFMLDRDRDERYLYVKAIRIEGIGFLSREELRRYLERPFIYKTYDPRRRSTTTFAISITPFLEKLGLDEETLDSREYDPAYFDIQNSHLGYALRNYQLVVWDEKDQYNRTNSYFQLQRK